MNSIPKGPFAILCNKNKYKISNKEFGVFLVLHLNVKISQRVAVCEDSSGNKLPDSNCKNLGTETDLTNIQKNGFKNRVRSDRIRILGWKNT